MAEGVPRRRRRMRGSSVDGGGVGGIKVPRGSATKTCWFPPRTRRPPTCLSHTDETRKRRALQNSRAGNWTCRLYLLYPRPPPQCQSRARQGKQVQAGATLARWSWIGGAQYEANSTSISGSRFPSSAPSKLVCSSFFLFLSFYLPPPPKNRSKWASLSRSRVLLPATRAGSPPSPPRPRTRT